MSILTSLPDPVSWHDQSDCVFMRILNMDIGFYKPYGVFALLPGGFRGRLTEPAAYVAIRPWFNFGAGWEFFTATWATQTTDYAGETGEPWDTVETFGWSHEFNVRDPPAGADVLIKNYIQLYGNHNQYQYITKITPYHDLDNLGLEYLHFVKASYTSVISKLYVEKTNGSFFYLPLNQAKDIKQDIPEAIMRIGLVYSAADEEAVLYIFDETNRWEHEEIEITQMTIEGTVYWVCRIGGANLTTPLSVSAYEEVVL